MYTLIRSMPFRQLFSRQAPALGASLVIAELLYKFHSFLLETGAFLATWFVIDLAFNIVVSLSRRWRNVPVFKA